MQAAPHNIVVKVGKAPEVKLDGVQHEIFPMVLKLAAAGQNVLLVGPSGCGKTHLAGSVAQAMNLPFGSTSVSGGVSESALTGYLLPTGEGGKFEHVPVPFFNAFHDGHLHLVDELDGGDANVVLVLNSALANGVMYIPQRVGKAEVKRHPKFVCIAAANTYGHGADMMYVGRNQLDAATLDRFYIVPMGYDKALEATLGREEVVAFVHGLREKVESLRLRRVVSSRMVMRMEAALNAGFTMKQAKLAAVAGWSRDDLSKVGAA